MKVSKIDAAEAQLNTAISLYFLADDPISVQTLCFAASEILDTLLRSKGKRGIYRADTILPEYREAYLATIKEPSNFFKHAGRDPAATLDFLPALNDLQLALACHGFSELTKRTSAQMLVHMLWVAIHYPGVFHLDERHVLRPQLKRLRANAASLNRRAFFTQSFRVVEAALEATR